MTRFSASEISRLRALRARPSTRSIASSSCGRPICSSSSRAESSAASFTRFARSAPVKPGVRRAMTSRSTPGASGLPRRVHREDRLAAFEVGTVDDDLAVEATGAQQRGIEDVGTVGRREQDHALLLVEAVHLDEQLVERLLALVVTAADARAAVAADGVDLVDEHDRRRRVLRLLEQVAHTRRADADEHLDEVGAADSEKNGTPASPATALASSVLPVPGGPKSSTPFGIFAPISCELRRVDEEVLDLLELLDRLRRARRRRRR